MHAFGGRSVTPLMDHENTFPVMFGRLLMQETPLLHKMTEGMRLRFVHCAARSTPPWFVANVMKILVQHILTHTLVGQNWLVDTKHIKFVVQRELSDLVLCCVLYKEGCGVDCGLLGGLRQDTWYKSSLVGAHWANTPPPLPLAHSSGQQSVPEGQGHPWCSACTG